MICWIAWPSPIPGWTMTLRTPLRPVMRLKRFWVRLSVRIWCFATARKTAFYLLLMEGDKPFRTRDLSKQIGSARLSFAAPEDMETYLGVTPGSATILALANDPDHKVQLILDRTVAETGHFGCHPCINTSTVNLSMEEVRKTLLPALGIVPLLVDLPDPRDEEA